MVVEHYTGKQIRMPQFAALAVGCTGFLSMLTADRFQSLAATAFALLSSIAVAAYVKSNAFVQANVPFPLLMTINFTVGLALGVLGTLTLEGTTFDGSPNSLQYVLRDRATFVTAAWMGLAFFFGISSFVACVKHLSVLVVGVAIALEPETSVLLNRLIVGGSTSEPLPTGLMLLGMLLITASKLFMGLEEFLKRKLEVKVDVTEAIQNASFLLDTIPEKSVD